MTIVERKQLGSVHEWRSERGSFRVEQPASDVLVFRARGHLEAEFVDLFEQVVDEAIKTCRPHLFWDGEQMVGYESRFRQRIGDYCVKVRSRVAAMNVYTPHRFVAMGAAVINVWLGGFFTIIRTREDFEKLLDDTRFGRT